MKTRFSHSGLAAALILAWLAATPALLGAQAMDPDQKPRFDPAGLDALLAELKLPLGTSDRASLASHGEASVFWQAKPSLRLCPLPAYRATIEAALSVAKPNLGVEVFAIAALPANLLEKPGRDLALFNALHRFRRMEGIEYWSQTRGRRHVLFTASRLVKSAQDRSALPDPVFSQIPGDSRYVLEQDDTTFGKYLYELRIKSLEGGALLMSMENLEQVWLGIIPVLPARGMALQLLIQPSSDGRSLFLYGNSGLQATTALGLGEKAQLSYYNRLNALFDWFMRGLAEQAG